MTTDYQPLIDELTWFAEQDKDFIALHESINTKAAEAIKALVAERELEEQRVADLMVQVGELSAERDAAFAMSKCECESNEACANLVKLHDEVERLKSEWGEPVAWEWKRTHLAGGYTRQVTISEQQAIEWAADSSNLHQADTVTPLYARKGRS